jgi:site-specific DNA-cytosine methylase
MARWQVHKETEAMRDTIKHIRETQPRSFLLENVEGFGDKDEEHGRSALEYLCDEMRAAGYVVEPFLASLETWVNVARSRFSSIA